MIIIGYQGIGKSTMAGKYKCIDLESSNFWIDGVRDKQWFIPYCNIAEHLSAQGYTVFVSSHEVVRNRLKNSNERVYIVHPSTVLKDEWIQKLKDRYNITKMEKDYKAYMNAVERYTENILDLQNSGIECHIITDMNYDFYLDILCPLNAV